MTALATTLACATIDSSLDSDSFTPCYDNSLSTDHERKECEAFKPVGKRRLRTVSIDSTSDTNTTNSSDAYYGQLSDKELCDVKKHEGSPQPHSPFKFRLLRKAVIIMNQCGHELDYQRGKRQDLRKVIDRLRKQNKKLHCLLKKQTKKKKKAKKKSRKYKRKYRKLLKSVPKLG